MIKNIGFDIDGVLQNYPEWVVNQFLKLHIEITGKKYEGRILLGKSRTRDQFPDCTSQKVLDALGDSFVVYIREFPFNPFVKKLFEELRKLKIRIHIVTARYAPDEHLFEELKDATIERFKKERIPVDEFHIGFEDKVQVIRASGIELMVEDNVDNILKISEYIPVFKMEQPYNKLLFGSNIYKLTMLYPPYFIEKLKYCDTHRNYLGMSTKLQEKPAYNCTFTPDNACIINLKHIASKRVLFVVPLSGEAVPSTDVYPATTVVDLYEIDKPVDEITTPWIRNAVTKYAGDEDIRATNELDSKTYMIRSKIIENVVETAIAEAGRGMVLIYGPQILQLERDILLKYDKYAMMFPSVNPNHRRIITDGVYKEGYKVAHLLEDLDEVSMNIRKLKIIAGLDPKRLPTYVSRQFFTSDGIDTVTLLSNERPYKVENLEAAISEDMFVIGDVHLSPDDKEKTDMIVNNINLTCNSLSKILFLGDFDAKGHTDKKVIQDFIRRITCKNIYMLVGNNDGFTIRDYADMGFLGVSDVVHYRSTQMNVVLSHCPVEVDSDTLNIHGHLHGGREYWNIDAKNHIDIWSEDYIPVRIRDAIEAYKEGLYRARSVNIRYY